MGTQQKYLVEFLSHFTHRQIFFAVWFILVSFFVLLMVSWYRKMTRRNFRTERDRPRRAPPKEIPNLSHREEKVPGATEV